MRFRPLPYVELPVGLSEVEAFHNRTCVLFTAFAFDLAGRSVPAGAAAGGSESEASGRDRLPMLPMSTTFLRPVAAIGGCAGLRAVLCLTQGISVCFLPLAKR